MDAGTRRSVIRVHKDSWFKQILVFIFSPFYFLALRWYVDRAWRLRKFNKKILDSLKIRREEMARWCKQNNTPLPDFWFPPHSTVKSITALDALRQFAGDNHIVFPIGSLSLALEHDKKPSSPETVTQTSTDQAVSESAKQAALAGYQQLHEIKRRFVRFYHSDGPFNSKSEAIRQFFANLTMEERYILVPSQDDAQSSSLPESKAIRTLTQTLREFEKKENVPWLNGFLL